ncbi:MAG: hypothetical protein H7X91_07760 [Burkholderiales bacterium]|nr:hypothetical protein [Burkholderiales bacterium]
MKRGRTVLFFGALALTIPLSRLPALRCATPVEVLARFWWRMDRTYRFECSSAGAQVRAGADAAAVPLDSLRAGFRCTPPAEHALGILQSWQIETALNPGLADDSQSARSTISNEKNHEK